MPRLRLTDLSPTQRKTLKTLQREYPTYTHNVDGRSGEALRKRKLARTKRFRGGIVAYRITISGRRLLNNGSVVV